MNCYICKHSKKDHIKTISDKGIAISLGCLHDDCKKFAIKCNEYFRYEPERLDGKCSRLRGHDGQHTSVLMYQM